MPRSVSHVPAFRLRHPSGRASSPDGRDHCLGRYDRLVQTRLANGRRLPAPHGGVIPAELLMASLGHAASYYVKAGRPTSDLAAIRHAVGPLQRLYAALPVADFGPLALRSVLEAMIRQGWSRGTIKPRRPHVCYTPH